MFIISLFLLLYFNVSTQEKTASKDSLRFSGQAMAWGIMNYNEDVSGEMGMRYIPQINYSIQTNKKHLFSLECSLNTYADGSFDDFDKSDFSVPVEGTIKPYRAWFRYSNEQLEVRAGLQKINFGSAQIFRPLMWFDGVDARDPLGLTDGVYALLTRYYFLNNTNIWLWGLYGNQNTKGWDWAVTSNKTPEFGGRIQMPVKNSEIGISFHHRKADLSLVNPDYTKKQENRIGFDCRIDWYLGSWIEFSWVNYQVDSLCLQTTNLKNQETITVGSDYTFNIGTGLYMVFEHMLIAQDDEAFSFDKLTQLSALGCSYPVGIFDSLDAYFYYDWVNENLYNFINWQHNFSKITFYTMAYWNPKKLLLPGAMGVSGSQIYAGKGIQLMIVYNY